MFEVFKRIMPLVFRNLDDLVDFQCNFPGKTSIGRGEQNNWSPPNSKAVSKEHAIVQLSGTVGEKDFSAVITDLDSRNGTFVGNGNPIEWTKVRGTEKLMLGDKIKFGTGGTPYQLLSVTPEESLNLVEPKTLLPAYAASSAVDSKTFTADAADKLSEILEGDEENNDDLDEDESLSRMSRSDDGNRTVL